MKLKPCAKAAALVLALTAGAAGVAHADPVATVTLNGGVQYLQTGTVMNAIGSGATITRIQYSLGSAYVGGATWDSMVENVVTGALTPLSVPGATFSNFLSNGRHFQTVAWTGLSLAPGATWSFGPLDMDLVVSLSPLVIDQATAPDRSTALNNATFSVAWSNGEYASIAINSSSWSVTASQQLTTVLTGLVSEPAALSLFGIGLIGVGLASRRRLAHS